MATTTSSKIRITLDNNRSWLISWSAMANGDDGDPITLPAHSDRSIQIEGTFGAGGSVTLEGSNDGVNYRALTDYQGNSLTFTSGGISSISEVTYYIRPRVTAGDGTTSLNAYLLLTGAL